MSFTGFFTGTEEKTIIKRSIGVMNMNYFYHIVNRKISNYVRTVLVCDNDPGGKSSDLPLFTNGMPALLYKQKGRNHHIILFGKSAPDPDDGLFGTGNVLLVFFYGAIYTIFAGFIVAKFSPNKPMMHAIILGVLGIALTLIAISSPNFSEQSELWFGYTLAAITIPCFWLGVKIQQNWNK